MKTNLTNVRTYIQFTQYGDVKEVTVNSNKLRALNIVKNVFGIRSVSVLREYRVENFGVEGYYTID